MRKFFLVIIVIFQCKTFAQELFVVTEPASNMPAGSVGVRVANLMMKEQKNLGYNYHLIPEFMWGVHKNLMIHSAVFLSNRNYNLTAEGGSLYSKYRFLSLDDYHKHFRMAGFARYSFNNSDIHQEEINLMGHNSGYQLGIVATQLLKKLAISGNLSFLKSIDNTSRNKIPDEQSTIATGYSLSFGKLIYPKQYTNFKQLNINIMLEVVGQRLLDNKKSFLDIVPSVQLIINSQARIDLAYIKQLFSDMQRTAPNGIYIKFEYLFFAP